MERLTERDDKGNLLFNGKQVYAGDFYEAASCLEEYEDTGLDPEQIQKLKDRNTAKAPDYEGDGYDNKGEMIYDTWICPNCGKHYEVDYDDYDFCPNCGQRLMLEERRCEK